MRSLLPNARLMVGFAAASIAGGCAFREYLPGSLLGHLGAASVREVGDLDLGFRLERDGTAPTYGSAPMLLHVHIGNRSNRSVHLDFGQMGIEAIDFDGGRHPIRLVDPRREMRPLDVEPKIAAEERIGLSGSIDSTNVARLCLDLRGVVAESPEAEPTPICFSRTNDAFEAEAAPR